MEGDADEAPVEKMFEGIDFDEKFEAYQEKEEQDDPLYIASVEKVSSIMTIWYISGVQTQDSFEEIIEEMRKNTEDEEEFEADSELDDAESDTSEEVEEEAAVENADK